jgi:hypothetical protein
MTEYVRHRARPQWGLGKVVQQTSDKVHIQFAHGLVTLDLKIAGPLLEAISAEEAAAGQSRGPRPGQTAAFRPQPNRTKRCINCADRLGDYARITGPDGDWQACPSCSARDGREHIFLPYPDAFYAPGEAPAEHDQSAAPADCLACRHGSPRTAAFRRCRQASRT